MILPGFLLALFAMCQHEPLSQPDPPVVPTNDTTAVSGPSLEKIDLLALGDSYTKGESVPVELNFPRQLVDSLRDRGWDILGRRVIAQTGWRTDNLKNAIANAAGEIGDSTFSLVTLCIGVNNQYQHGNFDTYKTEFEQLLQTAIIRAGNRPGRVVVLSIPDWAFTPYGQGLPNPGQVSAEIDQYNAANRSITLQYGVRYVDVTGISRLGLAQPNLVAGDGLHPSAKQYTEWVKALLPVVAEMLRH